MKLVTDVLLASIVVGAVVTVVGLAIVWWLQ